MSLQENKEDSDEKPSEDWNPKEAIKTHKIASSLKAFTQTNASFSPSLTGLQGMQYKIQSLT